VNDRQAAACFLDQYAVGLLTSLRGRTLSAATEACAGCSVGPGKDFGTVDVPSSTRANDGVAG